MLSETGKSSCSAFVWIGVHTSTLHFRRPSLLSLPVEASSNMLTLGLTSVALTPSDLAESSSQAEASPASPSAAQSEDRFSNQFRAIESLFQF
jgi:hypothetical protein